MERNEKLGILAEIFDCAPGALAPETRLDTLGWDSMAKLSLIAIVRARLGKRIPGADLKTLETVADVLAKME